MTQSHTIQRRQFLQAVAAGTALAGAAVHAGEKSDRAQPRKKPNLVFVFGDQWRAQATGYAGDPNVHTPNLDKLAAESVNFRNAVSCCPVCSPYRASLMTGQYPLTHGVFLNDVYLSPNAVSIAEALNEAGYQTAYIGKWHLDGHGRSSYIPPERRQGFQFWKALECTHAYNKSKYYAGENVPLQWDGYDAAAQTREAQRYIREETGEKPFALFLSWGPPHNPYTTAPEEYRKQYDANNVALRPNVPDEAAGAARKDLAGYYAHCTALDACIGDLLDTLRQCAIEEDTLLVFTSDHGDMLGSQGEQRKQRPWDEAIKIPLLLRYPAALGSKGKNMDLMLNAPDIMPTLLGLCGVAIPPSAEGIDYSPTLLGTQKQDSEAALIACYAPFGEWTRAHGGKEYRGVRTKRYTYVRDLKGPWLLYDNEKDPCQLKNLCGLPSHADIQAKLDAMLNKKLEETNDQFEHAETYVKKWGYKTNKNGTVPYTP